MKTRRLFYFLAISLLVFSSCGDDDKFSFTPLVNFTFESGDNLVTIDKGVMEYTVKGSVTSTSGLSNFVISTVNVKTGAAVAEIKETKQVFDDNRPRYEFTYTLTGLTENKAIAVTVTDGEGDTYKKNFVVRITPSVVFSDGTKNLESRDKYYGVFYAEWLDGRIYKSRNASEYAAEVNLALDDRGGKIVLISPAAHSLTFQGARSTKFGATDLTFDQFDAVTRVDDTLLKTLSPAAESVEIAKGNVYAYQTQDGRKGLVYIQNLTGNPQDENDPTVTAVIVTKVQAE